MAILVSCQLHPKFMARRMPTGACPTCLVIWLLVQRLRKRRLLWRLSYRSKVTS